MLRIPHCLDNRLTDGGKVVSPTHRPLRGNRTTPRKTCYSADLGTTDPKHDLIRRMASSGMLRRVALVRTDVSEEPSASFIRVTRIGELGATQAETATDARCEEIPISLQRASVASYS
jgi:hypothetical protein